MGYLEELLARLEAEDPIFTAPERRGKPTKCRCADDLLNTRLREGDGRNEVALHIALHLYHANVPETVAQETLLDWNSKQLEPLGRRELATILKQGYSGNYGLDCTAPIPSRYCHCECPLCTGQAKAEKKPRGKKKEEKQPYKYKSTLVAGGVLYDQIRNPATGESEYAYLDADEVCFTKEVTVGNTVYLPVSWDEMDVFTRFPSDVEQSGGPQSLLQDIAEHIHRYVELSQEDIAFLSMFVVTTWFIDRLGAAPSIVLIGDYGTGKSRIIDVVGDICHHAIFVSGDVSRAVIYRTLSQFPGGTFCFDEIDPNSNLEGHQALWAVVRTGTEPRRSILKMAENLRDVSSFVPYGPKLFALRRDIRDDAMKSRTYAIHTRRRRRRDVPRWLLSDYEQRALSLRNRLLDFRLRHYWNVDPEVGNVVDLGNLDPRLEQTAASIAVVFHTMPDMMEVLQKHLREMNRRYQQARIESEQGQVARAAIQAVSYNYNLYGDRYILVKDVLRYLPEEYSAKSERIGRVLADLGLDREDTQRRLHGERGKWFRMDEEVEEALRGMYDPYGELEEGAEV